MKKISIICLSVVISLSSLAQGTRLQPGGVPTPVPVYNISNIVYAVLQIIGTNFSGGGITITDLPPSTINNPWDVFPFADTNRTGTNVNRKIQYSDIVAELTSVISPTFPWLIVTNGSTAAVVQAQLNAMTGPSVLAFQPTNYNWSERLYLTNQNIKRLLIFGDGASIFWTNTAGILLTNYMFDTGTNAHGLNLIVDNLNFNGGTLEPYNTAAYYDVAHFIPNGIYGSVYWSNRTAMRLESSGGATVTRCTFTGWSGNAILGLSSKDILSYQSGKLWLYFNSFYTNFVDIMLPGNQFEVPGYNNSDSSLWNALTPHYAVVLGNNSHGSQIGLAQHASNTAAQENTFNDDYFGVSLNGAPGNHRIYDNNLNHCTYGVLVTGGGFGGNQSVIIQNNTIVASLSNALWGWSAGGVDFNGNFVDAGVILTNNSGGFLRNNVTFIGEPWGGASVPTNYNSTVYCYNNGELNGATFDPSQMSQVAQGTFSVSGGTVLPANKLGLLSNDGAGLTNWYSFTNLVVWTNQPTSFQVGQFLIIVGTNANGSLVVSNYALPSQTNFVAYDWVAGTLTTNAGNAVVLSGFTASGSPKVKGTNWPSGGSAFPLASDVQAATFGIQNLGTSSFTNSAGKAGIRFSPSFDSALGAVISLFGTTNDVASPTTLIASNLSAGAVSATGGNSNYVGGTTTITNIWTSTNTPPTSVTIGVTAVDKWIQVRDLSGNLYWTPVWTNH